MHRVQMTKQTRLSTILQMALDSAINALDCEDQFQTNSLKNENPLYTECLDHYGSACIHIENALKSGQFDTVQQNALLGCMETYQFRLGGLRSWYAASYSDQDRELVLSSRTRENLKVHRKEEPLLKDTILNSCLKKVTSKWSEIAGLDKVKESLQEGFIIPLRYPELFKGYIAIITGKRAITWLYRF
ncbi:hypothetical protein O6H91_20G024600 [Diphasiastrum complanatum]|uniref:Uncharacterized protein n=1 Tax=Diphasiastrum complanatum TaxID=34168 RepID=A0ACC2ANL8_DIPCM|nr:hypothetical protein O6H91_20G024600 [Diphasiastrum complanatum]